MIQQLVLSCVLAMSLAAAVPERIGTEAGSVKGRLEHGVAAFKGIPYAAPPVGSLRWRPPQPAAHWTGVREALAFAPRCMQARIYDDMIFRDEKPSEDCLYLNVWTAAKSTEARLPVMVWIHGGGFAAGASSEPRQDGENLSKKGVVVASMNYRLGVFGFFAHSELAAESGHQASGNYGLLDQVAALQWVHNNIAAFGGDPGKVTIFGESAGSFSVSALMASPLAQGLFQRAIGESGAFFGSVLALKPLAAGETADENFAESIGAPKLADLRAMGADKLLESAAQQKNPIRFVPNIDGYFLPRAAVEIYAAGEQSHVPLLAGWNRDEGSYRGIFGKLESTAANFVAYLKKTYPEHADELVKLYPATDDEQAKRSAQDLFGDQFIAFSTWKWLEMQAATGKSAVYRYEFDDAPPAAPDAKDAGEHGAYHSAEIEFVFEALASKKLPWRWSDEALSEQMSSYWANFAANADPNGTGLPHWPVYTAQDHYPVMHLEASSRVAPDDHRARYELLDKLVRCAD